MDNQNKCLGIYHALIAQLDKLARHNRQGSFQTRDRYYEAMKRFCRYLAREYRLQKLANISGKHLVGYSFGLDPELKHVPAKSERGAAIAVYAVFRTKGGGYGFEVMSMDDIRNHAQRYSKGLFIVQVEIWGGVLALLTKS